MDNTYRWTNSELEQKRRNFSITNYEILKIPNESLYHYTSREVFWKIMDGDSMLARHIMFSNDYNEYEIGKKKIRGALDKIGQGPLAETDALPFMICFCENEDLLSQWRGYANEGIALEFDFTKGMYGFEGGFSSDYCYTVMNQEPEGAYLSEGEKSEPNVFMGAIVSPYAVIYTDSDERPDEPVIKVIEKIKDVYSDGIQQMAISMIPYIKNNKFKEEAEYRLIFDMNQLAAGEYQHLLEKKYVYLDANGVRKPNIRVKFGNQYKAQSESGITVFYSNRDFNGRMEEFQKKCEDNKIDLTVVNDDNHKLEENEFLLSEGKNQEKACKLLRRMKPGKECRIWCDGHLPIRRIIVGPSKDAELMKNSIEEYIKTKYWTRDIKVDISQIPLRT